MSYSLFPKNRKWITGFALFRLLHIACIIHWSCFFVLVLSEAELARADTISTETEILSPKDKDAVRDVVDASLFRLPSISNDSADGPFVGSFPVVGKEIDVENDRDGENSENEFDSEDDVIDGKALWAECQRTLQPSLALIGVFPPFDAWSLQVNKTIELILENIEDQPARARSSVAQLQELCKQLEKSKVDMIQADRFIGTVGEKGTDFLTRYSPESRLELLDALRFGLEKRTYLWTLAINYFEARKNGTLTPTINISPDVAARLQRQTDDVRNFFGISPTGISWRNGFEVDQLAQDLERYLGLAEGKTIFSPVSTSTLDRASHYRVTHELDSLGKQIAGRINSIHYKIVSTPMESSQSAIFQREPLAQWSRMLQSHRSDRGDVLRLLQTYEIYEQTAGTSCGIELTKLAQEVKYSVSEELRLLGEAVDLIFKNPNAKVYISEALINRFLPIRDPEFDVVQETILNNPVAGRRRTDTQVAIKLVPDPEQLVMKLKITGRVVATTSSTAYPATFYNDSYATWSGEKRIRWEHDRLLVSPVVVDVQSQQHLRGVESGVDFVPFVGDIVREIARGQYEQRQPEIQRETKERIASEARRRIDEESNELLGATNMRMREHFFGKVEQLGLSFKMQNSKTTADWLLASLLVLAEESPGASMPEPPTLSGAFADIKIHDSSINSFLSRMELAGATFSGSELIAHIQTKLGLTSLGEGVSEGIVETTFLFAEEDPITIRFQEDRIVIRLAFDEISVGDNLWEMIDVTVAYRPMKDVNGMSYLARDGLIALDGPLSIRAQVPLRAIFTKIFPQDKPYILSPLLFQTDERFSGLALGLCRVSRGWFALSITRAPNDIPLNVMR